MLSIANTTELRWDRSKGRVGIRLYWVITTGFTVFRVVLTPLDGRGWSHGQYIMGLHKRMPFLWFHHIQAC